MCLEKKEKKTGKIVPTYSIFTDEADLANFWVLSIEFVAVVKDIVEANIFLYHIDILN